MNAISGSGGHKEFHAALLQEVAGREQRLVATSKSQAGFLNSENKSDVEMKARAETQGRKRLCGQANAVGMLNSLVYGAENWNQAKTNSS